MCSISLVAIYAEATLDGDIGLFLGKTNKSVPLSLSVRSVSLSILRRASWLNPVKDVLRVLRYHLCDLVPLHRVYPPPYTYLLGPGARSSEGRCAARIPQKRAGVNQGTVVSSWPRPRPPLSLRTPHPPARAPPRRLSPGMASVLGIPTPAWPVTSPRGVRPATTPWIEGNSPPTLLGCHNPEAVLPDHSSLAPGWTRQG